jgi:hypothetical protein
LIDLTAPFRPVTFAGGWYTNTRGAGVEPPVSDLRAVRMAMGFCDVDLSSAHRGSAGLRAKRRVRIAKRVCTGTIGSLASQCASACICLVAHPASAAFVCSEPSGPSQQKRKRRRTSARTGTGASIEIRAAYAPCGCGYVQLRLRSSFSSGTDGDRR